MKIVFAEFYIIQQILLHYLQRYLYIIINQNSNKIYNK